MLQGNLPQKLRELHDQYGDVVRVAPDELCFVDPEAGQSSGDKDLRVSRHIT